MEPPPPPPPPHGANAPGGKSGGLPDGKYDIFVIPPTSSGAGFLYLPSLQTQRNSFLAGCACTTFAFAVWNIMVPMAKNWLFDTMNGGGSGVMVLILIVGILAWAVGKTQAESTQEKGSPNPGGAPHSTSGSQPNFNTPPPNTSQPPPKSSWQRPQPNTTPGQKSAWEKAREETRKREEEKKKAEESKRKAEELEKRKQELEKERQKQREKDIRERLERERKETAAKEAAAKAKDSPSPTKRPPMPSARTEEEDDAYSFRPYDRPKHKANSGASVYSESSYAPSQSTARTTPPPQPTFTGPYSTKDPDKIMIKGVFSFNNAFMRTPIAQLVSGRKPVTDGLILRMSSEGLFIDDDRRNEAQREWDVKVWTMKLVEVCLPSFFLSSVVLELIHRIELRDCWRADIACLDS